MNKWPCEGPDCKTCQYNTVGGCDFFGPNKGTHTEEVEDVKDIVKDVIRANKGVCSADIVRLTGYTRPKVLRATKFLYATGQINRSWDGYRVLFEVVK